MLCLSRLQTVYAMTQRLIDRPKFGSASCAWQMWVHWYPTASARFNASHPVGHHYVGQKLTDCRFSGCQMCHFFVGPITLSQLWG